MQKQIHKIIFASEIITSELAPLDSLYKAENTSPLYHVACRRVL